jgi:hypothetical protein
MDSLTKGAAPWKKSDLWSTMHSALVEGVVSE